ncbi:MAG: toll/interleukin-1 receptor domain-containing protein [Alphaproteobacteria bacterium]
MSTAKIWLTYAWKDNADQDVDFIIQELEAKGLEVGFDRAKLLAGKRLWDQIDKHISDSELDAWAILVTKNSLQSEPCQEELAYALDRSLRLKGSTFPLIGIFPEPLDRELIPSSLATRLYVTLDNNEWANKIASAATQKAPARTLQDIPPYGYEWHRYDDKHVLEIWPRTGRWAPFFAGVKVAEGEKLGIMIPGTRGYITGTGMTRSVNITKEGYQLVGMSDAVTATTSAHIFFSSIPSEVMFGGKRDGKEETYCLSQM